MSERAVLSQSEPNLRLQNLSPQARFSNPDNKFGFTAIDHFAWPTLDVERMYRFVAEVLGGEPWFVTGYDPADRARGTGKVVMMRVGSFLVQFGEPEDGRLLCGKSDSNFWPHWCLSMPARDLERYLLHLRSIGIPVFGPISRGPATSAYFTTHEGHKIEVTTWETYTGALADGKPDWTELYHDWPNTVAVS
jgi:hypothetical protein